uniref:Lipase domain-containing protein n=1 Tax=Clastoptera arizonana TaxID=38151 RepID=A0A1B6D9T4_9HEMI
MRWSLNGSRHWNTVTHLLFYSFIYVCIQGSLGLIWNAFDISYWRCKIKRSQYCPDPDIRFYIYTPENRFRIPIDIRSKVPLRYKGWDENKRNVIIIHGFNGTERKSPMTIIRNAYLNRGDYNVFTVDFEDLMLFPCYLSSLSNTRLVAQCAAQFYSYLTANGLRAKDTHCVGHSLGAHICGMISNHLSKKMYKIIGLDPARPLVDRYGGHAFRLTRDDAHIVQVIHTNAGLLGESPQVGHVDFCVNGGSMQPGCLKEGRRIRQARCSHFMSACFFAATVSDRGSAHKAVPCSASCSRALPGYRLPGRAISMGQHTPETARGTYCIRMDDSKRCPFD